MAGYLPGRALKDYDDETLDRVVTINFTGQARVLNRLLPRLRAPAHVVMFSTTSAQRGSYDPIYAAAKGAVLAFVKSLATGLAPRVRAVA